MLKISLYELLTRGLPEGFLFVLGVYAFSHKKIVVKPYVISSLLIALFTFCIRLLDINFGVHTILNLILLICLCVFVNKLEIFTVVKAAMICTLLMFVFEMINVALLQLFFKDQIKQIMDNIYQKTIAGILGFSLFAITMFLLYYNMSIKQNIKGKTENGEISE